jgi:hypothetical protein
MASENDIPEREQRVANLLRVAAQCERAPDSLHARIAAMKDESARAPRRRLLPRPAFNFVRIAMPTAAAGAAALVLALGGGAGAPSIAQAAALATRAPSASAPAADPSDPAKLLTAKVGTLHFPNWQAAGGWRAVGQRQDHLGNRTVTTVYYAIGSSRVAYSIVSSPTLSLKHELIMQSRPPQYEYSATLTQHGRTTVVWVESGHTCLLTGPRGMSAARLRQLAFFGSRQPLNG